jgi:hypothetical protein
VPFINKEKVYQQMPKSSDKRKWTDGNVVLPIDFRVYNIEGDNKTKNVLPERHNN